MILINRTENVNMKIFGSFTQAMIQLLRARSHRVKVF